MKPLHGWSTDSIQHALERALTSVDPRLCPNLTGIEARRGPWFTEYQGRELDFIRDILGQRTYKGAHRLWAAERYIVEALFEHRFVAVYSARGTGKTFTAGVLVPTFFYTAPSRVVTISRTGAQIKNQVWTEINKVVRTNERLPGRKLTTKLEISPNNPDCIAIGMCARDPDAVRGYHASPLIGGDPDADELTQEDLDHISDSGDDDSIRLLLVVDEAQGIPEEVYRSLAGMFNKPNTYCLLIGNPTLGLDDDQEYVRSLTHPSSHYHTIKISAFPESQFPDDTKYDKVFDRPPKGYISDVSKERALKIYDEQDPVFLADWLGQFSAGSTSAQVVTRAILDGAPGVWQDRAIGPRVGLDIGTGKPDPCVATLVVNGKVTAVHEWRPAADDDAGQVTIVDETIALCTKWGRQVGKLYPELWDGRPLFGSERLSIDDSGLVGVGDILASRGVECDRVNFASKADGHWFEYTKPERFSNVRAEMHWVARRGLQEGLFCVPDEPDDARFWRTRQQAQWTHYFRDDDKRGPILKLEPKEKVIARHGRSPDHWDSAVLAFREARQSFTMGSFGSPHRSEDGIYAGRNGRRGRKRRPGWTRIQG